MNAALVTRKTRGLQTAWTQSGPDDSPILLLLHGYPDSPETWENQVDAFSKKYQVVCPYSRGAGPSEAASDTRRYGSDAAALDLLEILSEVDPSGNRKVVCIGHDLGAVHAWNVAHLLGNRLAGVVLLNGLSLPPMIGRLGMTAQHRRSWYIYGMQIPWLPEKLAAWLPHTLLGMAHRLGGLAGEKRLKLTQVENCLSAPVNQYRAFVRDIPAQRSRKLPRLQAPLLVLWGDDDKFLLTPTLEEWKPFAAHVTQRILPAGHWVHREQAKEVNRLLGDFLGEAFGLVNAEAGKPAEGAKELK